MTRRFHRLPVALLTCCGLLATGCIDDFDPPTLLTGTRPIGARFEVDGDPGRAWPAPGETVSVRWLVVGPGDPSPLTWGLLACPAVVAPNGDRFCAGEPFAFDLMMTPEVTEPSLDIVVPEAGMLGPFGTILVQGIICANGTPVIDLESLEASCQGAAAEQTLVRATLDIALEAASNQNPTIPDDSLSISTDPWTPPPAGLPLTGCAPMAGSSALPLRNSSDPDQMLRIAGNGADREVFVVDGEDRRENLRFAHYTTAGELDRQFSIFDDDAADILEVPWTVPPAEDVDPDGTLVRFHFVVSDERAGVAWTHRSICIVP